MTHSEWDIKTSSNLFISKSNNECLYICGKSPVISYDFLPVQYNRIYLEYPIKSSSNYVMSSYYEIIYSNENNENN